MSTILFVDDHHAFRTVFGEVLRTAGHTVLEAGTAAEAEHLLARQAGPIDLMVLEAVLSTSNGMDVARRVHRSHPEMRLLFISEESAKDLMKEGLLPKGALFLRKPFDAGQLLAALRQATAAVDIGQKTKQKLSKGSTRASNGTKAHKRVNVHTR